jgi:hypothetical protein
MTRYPLCHACCSRKWSAVPAPRRIPAPTWSSMTFSASRARVFRRLSCPMMSARHQSTPATRNAIFRHLSQAPDPLRARLLGQHCNLNGQLHTAVPLQFRMPVDCVRWNQLRPLLGIHQQVAMRRPHVTGRPTPRRWQSQLRCSVSSVCDAALHMPSVSAIEAGREEEGGGLGEEGAGAGGEGVHAASVWQSRPVSQSPPPLWTCECRPHCGSRSRRGVQASVRHRGDPASNA